MAVLVRAGARTLPAVRRALTSAGVPVDVDGNDLPLRHDDVGVDRLRCFRELVDVLFPRLGGARATPRRAHALARRDDHVRDLVRGKPSGALLG